MSEMQPYGGLAHFARQRHSRDATGADVAVLGVPYDSATTYRSGARLGPRAIREQSLLLWGYNNALGVDPLEKLSIVDCGDVNVLPVDVQATQKAIDEEATAILQQGAQLLTLGGDHSITLPLLRAHARRHGPLAVVHLDAHPDTWDTEFGPAHRYSHGTTFRRAIEEGLVDTNAFLQIGIRGPTLSAADHDDARRLGSRLITMDQWASRGGDAVLAEVHECVGPRPTYISLDIDVVDPAFAPGTGTPEVGGASSREILQLVRGLRGLNLVGFDLVEVAPPYDPTGITAVLAANLAFEFLSLLALTRG